MSNCRYIINGKINKIGALKVFKDNNVNITKLKNLI